MRRRSLLPLLAPGAFIALASATSLAAEVQAPPGCGDAASFEHELRSRVGAHAEALLAGTWVRIDPDPDGFHLFLQVGNERRELHDPSCSQLFTTAVVVAASFAAEGAPPAPATTAEPTPPPAPNTPAPPPSPPLPAEPAAEQRARPAHGPPFFGLGAGIGTSFGFLPSPSVAAELVVNLRYRRWGASARGRYFAPSDEQDAAGRGVSVQAAGADVSASWAPLDFLELRAGVNVRGAIGSGIGSPSRSTDAAWSVGPSAGARVVAFSVAETTFGIGADLTLDLAQPRFEILQYHEVFRASRVDGAVFLGAEHLFR